MLEFDMHPRELPMEERKVIKKSWINWTSVVMIGTLFVVVLAIFIVYPRNPPKPFEPNAIVSYHMRKDGCIELTPKEIVHLKEGSDQVWQQAVNSMRYWMNNFTRMEGITAFHVGSPYCYILLRQVDGSHLGIFNLKFTGYFKGHVVSRNEVSLSCSEKVKNVDRAQTIYVEYLDEVTGHTVVRMFNQTQSFVLQSLGFYLKGLSTCDDSDLGMKTLEKTIKS